MTERYLRAWINEIIKVAQPPIDQSLQTLVDLLHQGYTQVEWISLDPQDYKCNDIHGQSWSLEDFIQLTDHSAPIYSKTHVGCRCGLIVRGPNLPDVEMDAQSIW